MDFRDYFDDKDYSECEATVLMLVCQFLCAENLLGIFTPCVSSGSGVVSLFIDMIVIDENS